MATHFGPRLSRTEWVVVSLALSEADSLAYALPPRPGSLRDWMDRVVRLLTGIDRRVSLANPRLETVRRFVGETRRRRRPAEEFVPDLIAHGFSQAQVEALILLSV